MSSRLVHQLQICGQAKLYANHRSLRLLWRANDLFGGRSPSAVVSSGKQVLNTAMSFIGHPRGGEAKLPNALMSAVHKTSSYLFANEDGYWSILDRGGGRFLALATASDASASYLVRFALSTEAATALTLNRRGMSAFGANLPQIKMPVLIADLQVPSAYVTVESVLSRPALHISGIPTAQFLYSRWRAIFDANSKRSFLSDSSFTCSVINTFADRFEHLPPFLKNWLDKNAWEMYTDILEELTVGPVHGDLDVKNCWRSGRDLCVVDFDGFIAETPMVIDPLRFLLFGDLRRHTVLERAVAIREHGHSSFDVLPPDLYRLRSSARFRSLLLIITLLYDYASYVSKVSSPCREQSRHLLAALKVLLSGA